jgi:tetratricopeptide (TPR) repeat protein
LGGFLEMLLPLGLAYTISGRFKPLVRILLGYASLIILLGIGVTVSRGAWVSTAVALLVFFGVLIFDRRFRLPALMALLMIAGITYYFFPKSYIFEARARDLISKNGQINDDLRFALWQPALRIWRDNFWWGAGPAHYDYRFREYRPQEVQMRPERVHNDYLNTVADWGVAGAALVGSAWVLLALGLKKTWGSVRGTPNDLGEIKGSNKLAFVLGASLGLLALLCHSMVDFNMHLPANAILAISLMALVTSHLRFATERYWFTPNAAIKVLATVLLLAAGVYLIQQGWRQAGECVWLRRAAHARRFSPAQIEDYKRAFASEPRNPETALSIAEAYRIQSQEGGSDYEALARQAIEWFGRSIKLNRFSDSSYLGYGWCLDWLGRQTEAGHYFNRAAELDPNGYFTAATVALHYVELKDFAAAKPWLERSLHLQRTDNPIAQTYLQIVDRHLLESATNELSAQLDLRVRQ